MPKLLILITNWLYKNVQIGNNARATGEKSRESTLTACSLTVGREGTPPYFYTFDQISYKFFISTRHFIITNIFKNSLS